MLTVLEHSQDAARCESIVASRLADVFVKPSLDEFLLLCSEPCRFLRKVRDQEIERNGDNACEHALCHR